MSLFSFGGSKERAGVIIDIGSGSVLVAIVTSNPDKDKPTILWSHREQAPLRNIESIEQSAKSVMTSLINALLKFDTEGRRALHEHNKSLSLTEVQCCICAPWAYTVTKSIEYAQKEPFEITKSLLAELVETALKKTDAELRENEAVSELGLTIIARSTLDIETNGYRVKDPIGEHATELSLSHVSVVTQEYLADHIDDLHEKMLRDTSLLKISYMLVLYAVTEELFHETGDFCLVDITYEATEIGIVRDGSLTYSTHIPFGSFSLAREIANSTGLPLYQAFKHLHETDPLAFIENLPESQKSEVEEIFASYTRKIAELLHETGDDLSVPKRMYLHTEIECEPLFSDLVRKAGINVLKNPPDIRPFSSFVQKRVEVLHPETNTDTAMLVSAQFFHTQNTRRSFEYL